MSCRSCPEMHAQVPGDVCCCTVCGQWWSYDAYLTGYEGAILLRAGYEVDELPTDGTSYGNGTISRGTAALEALRHMAHDDVLEAFTAAARRMTLER
jgi:hypothetical protein